LNIIDGYYHNKEFIEIESLPIINVGDMVYFKYGNRNEKTKIIGVHHYFYENDDNEKIHHWMSVIYKDSNNRKHSVQGNWVIKE